MTRLCQLRELPPANLSHEPLLYEYTGSSIHPFVRVLGEARRETETRLTQEFAVMREVLENFVTVRTTKVLASNDREIESKLEDATVRRGCRRYANQDLVTVVTFQQLQFVSIEPGVSSQNQNLESSSVMTSSSSLSLCSTIILVILFVIYTMNIHIGAAITDNTNVGLIPNIKHIKINPPPNDR